MPLTTLAAGPALRSEVNANFLLCVLTDTAKTITVTHTWTAAQTFTGGFTAGALSTFSAGLLIDGGTTAAGRLNKDATSGLQIRGIVGATYDVEIMNAAGATVIAVPTGTITAVHTASVVGGASLRVPHGTAPTAPVNGDMWTTTAGLFVRINGATVGPLS